MTTKNGNSLSTAVIVIDVIPMIFGLIMVPTLLILGLLGVY